MERDQQCCLHGSGCLLIDHDDVVLYICGVCALVDGGVDPSIGNDDDAAGGGEV